MPSPLVRMIDVSKIYGPSTDPDEIVLGGKAGAIAVHDISFEIAPTDRIALMGPSGSGKTTLIHLVAGLDDPTQGRIEWPALGARDTLRPGPIGLAFQGPSLLPPISVAENVALPLLLAGSPEADAFEAASAMLARLSLSELADKLPEELSGGQSQRVGLARALITKPALVLADEPTGQQDREHGRAVMDFLLGWVEDNGAALLVATHDPAVAERLTLIWTMQDGHLETEESLARAALA